MSDLYGSMGYILDIGERPLRYSLSRPAGFMTFAEFRRRRALLDIKRRWRKPEPLVFGRTWRLKQRVKRDINQAWFGHERGPWFDRAGNRNIPEHA